MEKCWGSPPSASNAKSPSNQTSPQSQTPHRWPAPVARANATADNLFNAACLMAEMGLTQDAATRLISGNLPSLRRDLGDVEFAYQITRAFAWVAAKAPTQGHSA